MLRFFGCNYAIFSFDWLNNPHYEESWIIFSLMKKENFSRSGAGCKIRTRDPLITNQ